MSAEKRDAAAEEAQGAQSALAFEGPEGPPHPALVDARACLELEEEYRQALAVERKEAGSESAQAPFEGAEGGGERL